MMGQDEEYPNLIYFSNFHETKTASVKAIPPTATRVMVAWSVRLYVCRPSHSCTLLKPLEGMRCHLAGTLTGPK